MDGNEEKEAPNLASKKAPSHFASEIKRLKSVTLETAKKREFIPQPLFWSLFFSELDKVKREREQIRVIEDALSKLG